MALSLFDGPCHGLSGWSRTQPAIDQANRSTPAWVSFTAASVATLVFSRNPIGYANVIGKKLYREVVRIAQCQI
jgi:hypothetical protein